MGWSQVLLLALVGLAAADNGWKPGQQYKYNINTRTVAGLHQVANQYSGALIQGKLYVNVDSDNQLTLQIHGGKYADFNQNLNEGWATDIDESQVNYKNLPAKNHPFQLYMDNGVVKKMVVDKDISNWELNFLKGIASQFQVDLQAQNLKSSKLNNVPHGNQDTGVFTAMEETINGKYETIYDISVIPEYLLQSRPDLAPLEHLRGEGKHYRIVKTRNFSNSDEHMVYRFGMNGHEGWDAGTNTMGNFLARTSESTIVLSGKPDRYTIQSMETTEKVLVAPHLYNSQKGMVASRMNLTLEEVSTYKESSPSINNPRTVRSLVYEYEYGNPQNGDSGEDDSSSSSSSSSSYSDSSSSSEKHSKRDMVYRQGLMRKKRSPLINWPEESNSESLERIEGMKKYERQTSHSSNHHGTSASSSSSSSSSSSEDSISSSEEYLAPQPDLNGAPNIEFLPDNMINHRHGDSEQTVQNIIRVARQIGQSVNTPSEIPNDNILTLFAILTRLTGSSSSQQLQQATEKLYYPEETMKNVGKQEAYQNYRTWQAYRDAVAQAGNGPALVTMFSWIKSGKVRGNEAAQLLAVVPRAARYPTTEYMNYFFELVKSKEVQNQKYLNDSAVLSFADLVRRSQVDRESAHHRYPIHLSGSQSQSHRAVVAEQYIPYFQKELENAIAQEDSIKIQVYIRALSNTAHPKIFTVFEPYLEGKHIISNFQRLVMIAYLGDFINVHPNTARSILYRVYQNQGEVPEVRVAAVMQIMKTNPPSQMLQRMAEQTNYEQSKHVNAAVKSAIESAANGELYTNPQLVKNARSAANFLTTEHYGLQYSQNFIRSFISKEYNTLQNKHYLTYIKGLYGMYPNSILYSLKRKIGGYHHEPQTFGFMSSSTQELLNQLFKDGDKQKVSYQTRTVDQKHEKDSEYTYKKINELLNGEYDEPIQIEGNIFFSLLGGQRYYTFNKQSIKQMPEFLNEINHKLKNGINFQESKFYNQHSVEIGFPMVSGVRFTYSYNEPSMVHLGVKGKGRLQHEQPSEEYQNDLMPINAEIEGQYQLIWSQQKRGKMGFVAPYSEQRYIAAVEKNTQFYLPLKGKIEFNGKKNSFKAYLQPYHEKSNQQKLFQYSTNLYTTYHNMYDVKPYLKGNNMRHVHVGPNQSFQKTFGKEYTGYNFQIDAQSENHFTDMLRVYNAFRNQDFDYITSKIYHDLDHTMANNFYALSYNYQDSSSHQTEFSFYYNSAHAPVNDSKNGRLMNVRNRRIKSSSNMAQPSSMEHRVDELWMNVQSGIQNPQAYIFDASISFGGKQENGKYVFTVAHAESPVSEKSRFLTFWGGKPFQESHNAKSFQTAFQVDFKQPQLPIFNYKRAYEADPTSYVQGQINFEQTDNSKITFQGQMYQTEKRKQYMNQYFYSEVCEQQMQKGNYIQPACRNASVQANILDKYDISFKYQNLPESFQKSVYAIYSYIRRMGYQYNRENVVGVKNPEGTLNFGAQFSENLQYFNFSFDAPTFTSHFENVMVNHLVKPFIVQYPAYNQLYLFSPQYYYTKTYATCAVDNSETSTFNNRSYPINLGNCYHVLAMTIPQEYQQESQESFEYDSLYQKNFAILAKETGAQKKEVQVLLGDDVITLEPAGSNGVHVKANGKNIQISENKITRWSNGQNELQAYPLPGKSNVVLYFGHGFQIYYDGHRVAIMMPTNYRNKVRGMCGTFDGEPASDFTTPSNCVVKNYQHFAGSYAIPDASCQGHAMEYHRQAEKAPCYPKKIAYGDVVSDSEAGRRNMKLSTKSNIIVGQHTRRRQQGCSIHKIRIVKENGHTCFSSKPQVTCNVNCIATNSVQRNIDFHCLPDNNGLTQHWLNLIENGANPDFSQKGSVKRMEVLLPQTCVVN